VTYTYDPTQIKARGKDQMRFELGDTTVEGGANTCILSDEEYTAMLDGVESTAQAWGSAKLGVLQAILYKCAYLVDTKIDVLEYDLSQRFAAWKSLYKDLQDDLAADSIPAGSPRSLCKRPYFHTGMQENPLAHCYPWRGHCGGR
jgi:hypothetical protein